MSTGRGERVSLRQHPAARRLVGTTILVTDDDGEIRGMLRTVLTAVGATVLEAATPDETFSALREGEPDALVLDWHIEGFKGQGILTELEEIRPGITRRIVIVTGDPRVSKKQQENPDGPAVLLKPFLPLDLVVAIAQTLTAAR